MALLACTNVTSTLARAEDAPPASDAPYSIAVPGVEAFATEPLAAAEPLPAAIKTHPSKAVFGYLRSSDTAANIRWNLITHVCCFSVGTDKYGNISNGIGWPNSSPWSDVIANAHANGVKVILCVTCGDEATMVDLFNSDTAKAAFNTNIKNLLLAGDADGVNIDFEADTNTPDWKPLVPGFMCNLTTYLHAQIPGCEVSIAGPAVNWSSKWNLPSLASCCDYIFIMGYDFYGSFGKAPAPVGPSAPLTPAPGATICVTNTIDVQYANVPRNKLILGVPYYGNHWTTETSAAYSPRIAWQSPAIRFHAEQSATYGLLWDSYSQTPWYRWQDANNVWHQVWFDNAQSLGLKYDLADNRGLKGIGMWALNYDGTRPELWDLIDSRYGGTYAPPPNFDDDRDVDIEDFGLFQKCMKGPNVVQRDPVCARALLDGDLDVDTEDMAIFIECMKGPSGGIDSTCTH